MLDVDLIQVKPAMSKVIGTPCWKLPKIYLSFRHTKLINSNILSRIFLSTARHDLVW